MKKEVSEDSKKFAIYTRKSVFTGKGESLENQFEMCKNYIFTKYNNVDGNDIVLYEDMGYSGKNTDRPQFKKMISDIKVKKFKYIICYRLDRISRSVGDFATLIEKLNRLDISFVCIKEEFDTSTPMGKAMMYIASVFAQLERETIAERVRDNMLLLARTGRWLGGTTPLGYQSVKNEELIIDGTVKSSCKLEINQNEIKIVKTIFEKYMELRSVAGISKYLINNDIKTRTNTVFSLIGIKEILQNSVYCIADSEAFNYFTEMSADVCFSIENCSDTFGLLVYNKRDYSKKSPVIQPIIKWVVAIGKHQGIISGHDWLMVQQYIKDNKPDVTRPAKMHNDYSLLSGLLYCSDCNKKMFAKARYQQKDNFDYICSNKMKGNSTLCRSKNVNGQQIDDAICEVLLQYTNENSDIFSLLEELKGGLGGGDDKNNIKNIDEQLKKHELEIDNLVNALSENGSEILKKRVDIKLQEIDKKTNCLLKEREQLQNELNEENNKNRHINALIDNLSNFKNMFSKLSVHEKRNFIRSLVEKIVWDGRDFHIFMCGE